ncbi:hypothetical protein ACFWJT_13865 [Streptomyces sp. NPDC127069]|uniref:hypothetical protein n=1 Tax=Streptomyces sp. NPDC127069 TaxID=3347128 RepID=UPI003661C70A
MQRSQTIGFVSDQIAPHARGPLILGAQEAAAAQGLLLLLVNTSGDAELERTSIEMLLQRQVDGVVYAAMCHRIVELPGALHIGSLALSRHRRSRRFLHRWTAPPAHRTRSPRRPTRHPAPR